MDCYKPSHLVSITKELSNINKNLQSINQTLNQMEAVSRLEAGLITFNDVPPFQRGAEAKNS